MSEYYAYMYLRVDGTPYYIGKGKGKRAYTKHKTRWGGIYNAPPKERIVIYTAESEADAFETEIALIWYYGRKDLGTGILRNRTDGGEANCSAASKEWSLKNIPLLRERGKITGPMANLDKTLEEKIEQGRKGARIALATRTFEEYSAAGRKSGAASAIKRTFVKSLHVRWHVNRGIVKPGCPCCEEN